ncbi:MFS transporter [Microbulbifer salipaludis]|uniref:MFS transporter n=1 Tax=Microbulbifer salipaludis TaxID=187980 RepID=A0ABS3E302_9GAMM|nr:MFS transporter [Microbulbifer salipaludis]MBN8429657.1 MFS transporter [Microbulbifer salipaludis]
MQNALTSSTKNAYGMGQFAWAAKDSCFHYFLFFYYTQILGMSPSIAGLAAMLSIIADAISDPIVGYLSDKSKSRRWGRRHPFMAVSMLPVSLSLFAIFNPPAGLADGGLFAWYICTAILVRTALTFFVVPHMAMAAELSDDYHERTNIVLHRTFWGYAGGISLQILAWFILIPIATREGDLASGYQNVGLAAAILSLVGMAIAVWGTRSRIPYLKQATVEQQDRAWHCAFTDILKFFRVPSARILFLGSLILVCSMGTANTMLLHVNTFFYGFSSVQTGAFMLCVFVALIPATILTIKVTAQVGKRRSLMLFLVAAALVGPIPVLARIYDLAPASGTSGLLVFVCLFVVVHQTFFIGAMSITASMAADVTDDIEIESGLRQEGSLNSALMLIQKVTFGVGTLCAGFILDFAGFTDSISPTDVTADMLARLGLAYGPGISLIMLASVYIFSFYRSRREQEASSGLDRDAVAAG